MAPCKRNREILGYFLPKIIHYGLIGLLSVVLLSESVGARATFAQLQIAQQTAPAPSVPIAKYLGNCRRWCITNHTIRCIT